MRQRRRCRRRRSARSAASAVPRRRTPAGASPTATRTTTVDQIRWRAAQAAPVRAPSRSDAQREQRAQNPDAATHRQTACRIHGSSSAPTQRPRTASTMTHDAGQVAGEADRVCSADITRTVSREHHVLVVRGSGYGLRCGRRAGAQRVAGSATPASPPGHLAHREHGLGARADVQRAQHRGDVVLHRLDRELELARDQLVRLALQQQREHVGLARRQAERGERRAPLEAAVLAPARAHAQHARHRVAPALGAAAAPSRCVIGGT